MCNVVRCDVMYEWSSSRRSHTHRPLHRHQPNWWQSKTVAAVTSTSASYLMHTLLLAIYFIFRHLFLFAYALTPAAIIAPFFLLVAPIVFYLSITCFPVAAVTHKCEFPPHERRNKYFLTIITADGPNRRALSKIQIATKQRTKGRKKRNNPNKLTKM